MKRRHQRGQALIEMAFVLPVLIISLMGAWTAASLIAANDTAAQATGYGARIAAEIGNNCSVVDGALTCNATADSCQDGNGDNPCAVDDEIISAMQPELGQLTNASAQAIYIYEPQSCVATNGTPPAGCSGAGTAGPTGAALTDEYEYCSKTATWDLIDGTGRGAGTAPCITGEAGQYLLNDRLQTPDQEQSIGVAVYFKFTAPVFGFAFFDQTDSAYTDITFPPEGS